MIKLRIKSINFRIMLAFIIINITVTSFFSCFVYWVASSIIQKNYINLSEKTITDAIKRVDMFLDKIDKYSLYLTINPEIIKILTKDYGENINYPRLFAEQVENLTVTEGDMLAIHYLSNEGDVYHFPLTSSINSLDDLKRQGLIDGLEMQESKIHWSNTYSQIYYQSDRQQKVNILSGIRSFKVSFQQGMKGILLIDINEESLFEYIRNIKFGDTSKIYIVDKTGSIITSTERYKVTGFIDSAIARTVNDKSSGHSFQNIDGVKNLVVYNTSPVTQWKIIATVPLKEVLYQTGYIKGIAVLVAIAVIIFSSAISFFISSKITRPIRDMTRLIKHVARGNLDVKYEVRSNDELRELSDGFNYMTANLKELINKIYVEEIQLKQAQLENLKSKINPHFLYNTLDTIYWMLIIARQNDTAKLVVALSDMLRYSISKSEDQVTIREEIKQIDNYLFIQKTRFKDRLDVEYEIEDSIIDCYIMKLILQPIVENSIKHGLECQSKKGRIIIRGFGSEEKIILQVIDDGKGMSEDEIRNVLNSEYSPTVLKKPEIGINNVNERLKMYYGHEYGLFIESRLGEGTCVSIHIPKVVKSEEGQGVEDSCS